MLPTVLIVEDDSLNQELLSEQVEDICEVLVASDGTQALSSIRAEVPDLILLDLNMPRMNGFQLIERLSDGGFAIPIVVVTAMDLRRTDYDFFRKHRIGRVFQKGRYSEEELQAGIQSTLRQAG